MSDERCPMCGGGKYAITTIFSPDATSIIMECIGCGQKAETIKHVSHPWQIHHFWWGVLCLVAAFVVVFYVPQPWAGILFWPLTVAGVWLIADDLFQHWKQRSEPEYESPIHRWWVKWRTKNSCK